MTDETTETRGLRPADPHYRAWVGNPANYDLMSSLQFDLLTQLGLREHHSLLDLGCGSLRGGRLFIPYLLPGRYFGIEPQAWAVEEGIEREVGRDQVRIKRPTFSHVSDFRLTVFERRFDFILAQSIFSHASRDQVRFALSQAREALEPEGLMAATFLEGDQDYAGDEWVYPDCIPYRLGSILDWARDAGLHARALDWAHHAGQRWFVASPSAGRVEAAERVATKEGALQQAYAAQLVELRRQVDTLQRHPVMRAYLAARRMLPFRARRR